MAANQRWRHMASCFTQEHFKDVDTPAYKTMTQRPVTEARYGRQLGVQVLALEEQLVVAMV